MTDFSNLNTLGVDPGVERRFTFRNVYLTDKPVWITSRVASVDYNDAYRAEVVRRAAERSNEKIDLETINLVALARENDKVIMAASCPTGWGEVVDAKGKVVEFSPEECLAFFKALPDDIFDDYRAWVVNVEGFRRKAISGRELGNAPPSA